MRPLFPNSMLRFIFNARVTRVIILLCISVCSPLQSGSDPQVSMDTYFEKEAAGLNVWVGGESMITPGKVKGKSSISLEDFNHIEKMILVWSGEVNADDTEYTRIHLKAPSRKIKIISADKTYTKKTLKLLYACFADITNLYAGKGVYEIRKLRSDPVNLMPKPSLYSVGGYAVIVIYKKTGDPEKKRVLVQSGLLVLKPGEMYSMSLLKNGSSQEIQKLYIIGGHGQKGNASANLINGLCISGKEDWDGSAGMYWDIDEFDLKNKTYDVMNDGVVLSFDSLLQWIYPLSVVTVFKMGGN